MGQRLLIFSSVDIISDVFNEDSMHVKKCEVHYGWFQKIFILYTQLKIYMENLEGMIIIFHT